jgi:hypothetical protein
MNCSLINDLVQLGREEDSHASLDHNTSGDTIKSKKKNPKLDLVDKIKASSSEEIAQWISALKDENLKLRQQLRSIGGSQKSQSPDPGRDKKIPAKAPNGTLSAAYGFVGSKVRPKDAAKAEIWGSEAAPAALREVEGGGPEWESQPSVGFKPIGYIESCFLDKNGTPRQVQIGPAFSPNVRHLII